MSTTVPLERRFHKSDVDGWRSVEHLFKPGQFWSSTGMNRYLCTVFPYRLP